MENTYLDKSAFTYHLVQGFSGGRLHSKKLRRQLNAAGYAENKIVENADIIITHSAGYWTLTDALHAKIIMHIGPALPQNDYRKTYRNANLGMWREAHRNNYLRKRALWSFYGLGYLLFQPRHNTNLARFVKNPDQSYRPPHALQTILIENRDDPWPKSDLIKRLLKDESWAFIGLPGSHEHIQEEPHAYVEILDHYAKRLLA